MCWDNHASSACFPKALLTLTPTLLQPWAPWGGLGTPLPSPFSLRGAKANDCGGFGEPWQCLSWRGNNGLFII